MRDTINDKINEILGIKSDKFALIDAIMIIGVIGFLFCTFMCFATV